MAMVVALAHAWGCGNLSNDDLIFLAGVPRAEEVAVAINEDGATANALTGGLGDQAEYYVHASDVSTFFDTVVGMALEWVDNLGWGFPPTHRSDNTRIWGPVRNVDGSGITLRLEIRRDRDGGDGPIFSYCLHAGPDSSFAGESPSCEQPSSSGLRLLMWGWFAPRASEDEGRAGRGEMHIDFEALRALGLEDDEARGLLNIGYDFEGGGAARALHIEWLKIVSLTAGTERLEYDFTATEEGDLGFTFAFELDVYGGTGEVGFTSKEDLTVEACWNESGPGRADVTISGGDLIWGETATILECWDPHHDRTYYSLGVDEPPLSEEEGDVALCPTACRQ